MNSICTAPSPHTVYTPSNHRVLDTSSTFPYLSLQNSVKNFQLVVTAPTSGLPVERGAVSMQFGRVGKNEFHLDFQWPFTGLQAFGMALSAFDHKMAHI